MAYPTFKSLELHYPGFFIGTFLRSKRFITQITMLDTANRVQMFTFAPYATVSDLCLQIDQKYQDSKNTYWLSCCGKPLRENISLNRISGLVIMNGRLLGECSVAFKTAVMRQEQGSLIA